MANNLEELKEELYAQFNAAVKGVNDYSNYKELRAGLAQAIGPIAQAIVTVEDALERRQDPLGKLKSK